MTRQVKVSLEAFGKSKVSRVFTQDEIQGKNVGDLVNYIVSQESSRENSRALATIRREMGASGGYGLQVGYRPGNAPVRYQPARLDSPATEHIIVNGSDQPEIRVVTVAKHVVGNY